MAEQVSRRRFIQTTASIGAALAIGPSLGAEPTPPERIVLGVMGVGGRGLGVAQNFAQRPGAEVKYVCDVDDTASAKAAAAVAKRQTAAPTALRDFRKILDDKEVTAIVIAAPDHWHAPAAIMACAAGKHVYVEKPCCHNPHEGELLVAAARKYNRVVQHGTQRRSYPRVIEAIEKLRAGELGAVHFARGWYDNNRVGIGHGVEAPVPTTLDWDLWQGPAPAEVFHDNYVPYKWHWFWRWGTGELGNNGTHTLDVCRWGLGVEAPRRVTAGGGRYCFSDDQQTPDTMLVTYDFGDKMIAWEGRSCQARGIEGSKFGIGFYGEQGTMILDSNGYTIYDPKDKVIAQFLDKGEDAPHFDNFLNCIRASGDGDAKRPNADIEEGFKSVLLCHLGNIAWRTGRTVNFDQAARRIVDDKDQQALWGREYRAGWEPVV